MPIVRLRDRSTGQEAVFVNVHNPADTRAYPRQAAWRAAAVRTEVKLLRSLSAGGDAVFLACTNLRTYDLIASLEQELGVPVITANQVTMWAVLAAAGVAAVGPGQSLLERRPA